MDEKLEIINEIKKLIDQNSRTNTEINPKYLDFFELDELKAIKDDLEKKKKDSDQETNIFLDTIFTKCS